MSTIALTVVRCFVRRSSIALAAVAAVAALSLSSVQAEGLLKDLPSQSLADALEVLSKDTGLQVLYTPRLAAGITSRTAPAGKSVEETLKILLRDTGLTYQFVNERTVTIVPLSAATEVSSIEELYRANPDLRLVRVADSAAQDVGANPIAQSKPASSNEASKADDKNANEVVVTGTTLSGAAPKSLPKMIIDQQALQDAGFPTIADYLEFLPQNFANSNRDGFQSRSVGEAPGINLRGLGSNETLILLNGQRVAPSGSFGSAVDVSMIPVTALERVDILLDGASATYGADAVAGVANFVLRRNVQGVSSAVQWGTVTDGGHDTLRASATGGTGWGSGSATLSYEYYNSHRLNSNERDYTATDWEYDLTPNERRNSFVASVQQEISSNTVLSFDSIASLQDIAQRYDYAVASASRSDIDARFYLAQARLASSVLGWKFDLDGAYSKKELTQSAISGSPLAPTTQFTFNQPTHSWSSQAKLNRVFALSSRLDLNLALGVAYRREAVGLETTSPAGASLFSLALNRNVRSGFAEALLPMPYGDSRSLELSLAVRSDEYNDVGGATNPKIGLAWQPARGLLLRTSYGTSFRAPELRSLTGSSVSVTFLSTAYSQAFPQLGNNVVAYYNGPNPALQPQRAKNFTLGGSWEPIENRSLKVDLNYFNIVYRDQISTPATAVGGLAQAFLAANVLADKFVVSPTLAQVQALMSAATQVSSITTFVNLQNPATLSSVNVIFDNRSANLSKSTVDGIDFSVSGAFDAAGGRVALALNGAYLLDKTLQAAGSGPSTETMDSIGTPAAFRARTSASYSHGAVSSGLFWNYVDSYRNQLGIVGMDTVKAWNTIDLFARYEFASARGWLGGLSLTLNATNVFDKKPPYIGALTGPGRAFPEGFDSTNSNPMGRFVSATVQKSF